jgi:hypothetical protein
MTSRDFCYWLQGYFELSPSGAALTTEQTDMVRRHLALVFKHEIDPSYGDEKQQAGLNAIHAPPSRPQPNPNYQPNDPHGLVVRC